MPRRVASGLALVLSICSGSLSCTNDGGVVVESAGGDVVASCGNGTVEDGEECDGSDDCTTMCTQHVCGDAILGPGEACDDANEEDGDACTASCELGPEAILDIALGENHTCAVSLDSRVKCWGASNSGTLGQAGYDENIGDNEPPSDWDDVLVADDIVQLVAGHVSTCAVRGSGTAICWGSGGSGKLGYETTDSVGDDETPAEAGDLPLQGIDSMALGRGHSCALLDSGDVTCWGSNEAGQLGYGDVISWVEGDFAGSRGPVALSEPAVEITAGERHTCARLQSGDVTCWGGNNVGQLGTGTPDSVGDDETPASVGTIDLGGKAVDIDTFWNTTCAVLDDGGLRCWGANTDGQLGNGDEMSMNIGDRKTPAEAGVVQWDGEAVSVQVGTSHVCAVTAQGTAHCWGHRNRVGYNDPDDSRLPGPQALVGSDLKRLEIGKDHTCAITGSAGVRCWGTGARQLLGYPEYTDNRALTDPTSLGDVDVF